MLLSKKNQSKKEFCLSKKTKLDDEKKKNVFLTCISIKMCNFAS